MTNEEHIRSKGCEYCGGTGLMEVADPSGDPCPHCRSTVTGQPLRPHHKPPHFRLVDSDGVLRDIDQIRADERRRVWEEASAKADEWHRYFTPMQAGHRSGKCVLAAFALADLRRICGVEGDDDE